MHTLYSKIVELKPDGTMIMYVEIGATIDEYNNLPTTNIANSSIAFLTGGSSSLMVSFFDSYSSTWSTPATLID